MSPASNDQIIVLSFVGQVIKYSAHAREISYPHYDDRKLYDFVIIKIISSILSSISALLLFAIACVNFAYTFLSDNNQLISD